MARADKGTPKLDLTGRAFGRWVVVAYAGEAGWLCRCQCGAERPVRRGNLCSGRSQSCGCVRVEQLTARRTHGHAGNGRSRRRSLTYSTWCGMRARCQIPSATSYAAYGGSGIKVCERWEAFENFLSDMGEKPGPGMSLDRYPNNAGNYEPGNVRWATAKQQRNNQKAQTPASVVE